MQDSLIYKFLSFLPIILLIALSIIKNIRTGVLVSFIFTSVLYFIWGSPLLNYLATLISSLVATVNILMIVFGAIFLYEIMKASGYIHEINHSVKEIHHSREIRFFLISIGLTGFFEGVAGFGTPGAIVPLLLISMGFNPVLSVVSVLLFDGLFAAFGAVGTPLIAGIKIPLHLNESQVNQIAIFTAILLFITSLVITVYICSFYKSDEKKFHHLREVVLMITITFIPFVIFAYIAAEYATILASALMLLLSVVYLSKGKLHANMKGWLPYLCLVAILLIPKLIEPLKIFLEWEVKLSNLFATPISASIKPLKSPLIPFVIVALLFSRKKEYILTGFMDGGKKIISVTLLLLPVIAVAQLMLTSGNGESSMINVIAHTFSHTGKAYVFISPFIGILGAFITGSTTVSNIVFSHSQLETAQILSIDPNVILSLQLAGGSLGNAICLFNIIAACSVAGIAEPNKILIKNLTPTIIAGTLIGIASFAYLLMR